MRKCCGLHVPVEDAGAVALGFVAPVRLGPLGVNVLPSVAVCFQICVIADFI